MIQSPIKPDLIITRVFGAPRELVFRAWVERDRLARWWGPGGFTNPVCEIDVRPGGAIRIDMRAPDGTVFGMGGAFVEVVAPERIVFTSTAMPDENGEPQLVNLNTVEFAEVDGKTELTLTVVVQKRTPAIERNLDGMPIGWTQSFDRLSGEVGRPAEIGNTCTLRTTDREVIASRVFDAPRDLVWAAWTNPDRVARWWGPNGFTTTVQELDLRRGGLFRLVMTGPDGREYPNKVRFSEVAPDKRLVCAHCNDDDSERANLVTEVTFVDLDGKTEVTSTMIFGSTEELERLNREYGAVRGVVQHLANLASYLAAN